MRTKELPLVAFTLITQMAVGLVLLRVLLWPPSADTSAGSGQGEWIAALAMLIVAIALAALHLGHPLGAIRMLTNLGSSWLSREILGFGLFGVLLALIVLGGPALADGWLARLAALVGLAALLATAMTYALPSVPALSRAVTLVYFLLSAWVLGVAGATYFAGADQKALLTGILTIGVAAGLAAVLAAPLVCWRGSALLTASRRAALRSPLYWIWVGALAGSLGTLVVAGTVPGWLPPVIVLGEVAGRALLLNSPASSASRLGRPF
jgi:DMSO reductase anchor subunit